MAHAQESILQFYADFEFLETSSEGAEAGGKASSDAVVATKIDEFIQAEASGSGEGSNSDSFKSLAEEFSVADANVADVVNSLLTEKRAKDNMTELQNKYLRPENCANLVAHKINKQIWQQLRQETRNNDSAFQKAQSSMLSGLYAVL